MKHLIEDSKGYWYRKHNLINKITSYFNRYNINKELKFDQPVLKDEFESMNGACVGMKLDELWSFDEIFLIFDEFTDDENEAILPDFELDELSKILNVLKDMYPESEEAEKFNL